LHQCDRVSSLDMGLKDLIMYVIIVMREVHDKIGL
jgi:hypothetical protein